MKKISLLLLMGILYFNIINFSVNAQSANTANDNYCSLLEQLGIMSVSSEDTYVTIPEFLQMVFHLTNYHASDNIMDTAVQLGYITTKKQTELTLVDAVEIMIRVMGRQPSVSESIPYPYNYYTVAQNLKMLSGIPKDYTAKLSYSDCARFIYNCLEIKHYYSYSSNSKILTAASDNTFLSILNLIKIEGVITDINIENDPANNRITMLYKYNGYSDVSDSFYCEFEKVKEFLGYRMIAFAYDFNSRENYKILAISPKNTNSEIEIDSKYFGSYDYKASQIAYRKSESDTKDSYAKIKADASVYLNGVLKNKNLPVVNDMLNVFSQVTNTSPYRTYGKYKLIDNDNDGIYEVILITKYLDYLVSSINLENNTVYDKFRDSVLIFNETDLNKENITFVNEKNEPKKMEDIKKAKLISVASAEDDNLMTKGTVVICENVVTGSVDEMEILTDLSGKVTVADNPYYYYITKNLTSADFLDYGIAAGDTGKFYTNAMGDIVYKDIKSSLSTNYALLMGIAKKQDITDECEIKLFDATGEIKLFSVADRLIFRDGTSDTQKITLRDKKIAQQLLGTADNISILRPITYKLNQDNQICELSYSYPNIDKKPMKQVFTMDRQFNKPDSSNKASYNKYNKSIGDLYLKDDTVIFSINNVTADDYIANKSYLFNDEDISIVDMSDIPAEYQEYCEGFSIQDGNEINMMVMLNVQQQKKILPYFSIVKSTSKVINKAGDVTTKLVCLENGNEIEYFLTADCNIAYDNTYFKGSFSNDKGIEANDLIAYEKGAGGEIRKLRIIMRTNAVCNYLPDIYSETREAANVEELNIKLPISASIIGEQIDYYFGLVTSKYQGNKTNKITLTVNDDKIIVRDPIDNGDFSYDQKSRMTVTLPLSDELPILRFEANMKNKLQKISFSDIAADAIKGDERTGDLAFVKTVNGSITEIYLIGI